jgi:hypothetical protein
MHFGNVDERGRRFRERVVAGKTYRYYADQGRRLGSIFSNISANAVYLNRSRRVNWGVGAFRTKSRNFEGDRVVAYDETAYGAIGLLRYPLSRFTRIEGTVVIEHSDRVDFTLPVDEPRRVGWIASHYVSYVRDNSLWLPADDRRQALRAAGVSSDFSNSRDSYLYRATGATTSGWAGAAPGRCAPTDSTAAAIAPAASTSAAPSASAATPSSGTSWGPRRSCSIRRFASRCSRT